MSYDTLHVTGNKHYNHVYLILWMYMYVSPHKLLGAFGNVLRKPLRLIFENVNSAFYAEILTWKPTGVLFLGRYIWLKNK